MFFSHLPLMPDNLTEEQLKEANNWLQVNMKEELWSTIKVCELYKMSTVRLNQLNAKYVIPGHIRFESTHMYIAKYAGPWFDAYRKRADQRKVRVPVAGGAKKAGRPKKVKGQYTYTLFGKEYTDTRPAKVVWDEWLDRVAAEYPQYHDGRQVRKEVAFNPKDHQHYVDHVLPIRTAINAVFRKLWAASESSK